MSARIALVVVSLILSVLIGLALKGDGASSSGTEESSDKKIKIGLSMDTLEEERWKRDRDMFVARAEALGAEVMVLAASSDDTQQIKDIDALITNAVDVIVIVPHDGAAMAKGVEMAHQAGIPCIAYDRLITNCDLDLYITFDNVRVGELQAKYLVENLPKAKKNKIVRIYGAKTDNNALLFKQGQDNILNSYIEKGIVEVIHEDWAADWNPENAKKICDAAITNHGTKFQAVLASNDGTAGGAIQALKEEGISGSIVVTGQDAERSACQRIVNGTQSMTIYKPIKLLAERSAEIAFAIANREVVIASDKTDNGKKEVPSLFLEITAVDKNNMMDTVVADKFHSKADIYGE